MPANTSGSPRRRPRRCRRARRRCVKSLLKTPAGAVAFQNVQVFDADARKFLADQTVVVDKGRITAVGPSKSVKVPTGAQVIDGRGKTLLPGLWDCHMHIGNDFTGLQELSMGVTSLRDPGNDDGLTLDRRARAAKGELLMPNVYPSSLIDGKGPYAAQTANVATSQAEMIGWIDKAKANGFTGVKFYGTLDKAWVPAAAAQAHKLGLHVHGHIPARHASARGHQRRLRRDHAHQLGRDAGHARHRHRRVQRHPAFRRTRAVTPRISISTASP